MSEAPKKSSRRRRAPTKARAEIERTESGEAISATIEADEAPEPEPKEDPLPPLRRAQCPVCGFGEESHKIGSRGVCRNCSRPITWTELLINRPRKK